MNYSRNCVECEQPMTPKRRPCCCNNGSAGKGRNEKHLFGRCIYCCQCPYAEHPADPKGLSHGEATLAAGAL